MVSKFPMSRVSTAGQNEAFTEGQTGVGQGQSAERLVKRGNKTVAARLGLDDDARRGKQFEIAIKAAHVQLQPAHERGTVRRAIRQKLEQSIETRRSLNRDRGLFRLGSRTRFLGHACYHAGKRA